MVSSSFIAAARFCHRVASGWPPGVDARGLGFARRRIQRADQRGDLGQLRGRLGLGMAREELVDEAGVQIGGAEIRRPPESAGRSAMIGADPGDVVFAERAEHARGGVPRACRPTRRAWPAADRNRGARSSPGRRRNRARTPGPSGRFEARDLAGRREEIVVRDLRRRRGIRWRSRASAISLLRAMAERSPAAISTCSRTRSRPVTSSVTGCSTWRRVFISRK